MTTHQVPGTSIDYHLVRYDEDGTELPDGDGSRTSAGVLTAAKDGVTDVFLLSHGWKGDVPAAIRQYDTWIGAMVRQQADRDRIRAVVPDFKALLVGLHWPSLPFGDEKAPAVLLGDSPAEAPESEGADEFADEARMDAGALIDAYVTRLTAADSDAADRDAVRTALARIVAAADEPEVAERVAEGDLPDDLAESYATLYEHTLVASDGATAAPGADNDVFDPRLTIEQWAGDAPAAEPAPDLLLGPFDGLADLAAKARQALLMPVRQLSFWTMKRRARVVGESGMHDLLAAIQREAPSARVHLMGHSFGCIVVSAAVAGPVADDGSLASPPPRPVSSLFLVQGAMSLWSYADDVPFAPGSSGYFRAIRDSGLVTGPIVTTRSEHDTAVGRLYPLGARVADDVLLGDDLPKFGGIGAWGIQGTAGHDTVVLAATEDYGFTPGEVFNIEASRVISAGGGPSGAHSDIAHDEIAHLMWQAVTVSALASPAPDR